MKRWIALALAMACLMAHALGEDAWDGLNFSRRVYHGAVAPQTLGTQVDLRTEPDAGAESLGRFYGGTPVYVLDSARDDQGIRWACVEIDLRGAIGDRLQGYMPADSLMLDNVNYEAPILLYCSAPKMGRLILRSAPGGTIAGLVAGEVFVLADAGDGWLLILDPALEQTGYVQAQRMQAPYMPRADAFMIPADGGQDVPVYADPALTEQIAAYYPGVQCRLMECSPEGGWARVAVTGDSGWTEDAFGSPADRYVSYGDEENGRTVPLELPVIRGYVSLADVKLFLYAWQVGYALRTGVVLPAEADGAAALAVPPGTAVSVLGRVGDQYHIRWKNAFTLADQALIRLSDAPSGRAQPARQGYAWLGRQQDAEGDDRGVPTSWFPGEAADAADDEGAVYEPLAEIIGQGEGWYQLRQRANADFYAQEAWASAVIREDSLWHNAAFAREEDAWQAEEADAGLWLWTVQPGDTAHLTLGFPEEGVLPEEYAVQAAEDPACYTVYIPAGTQVSRTGGSLTALTKDGAPTLLEAQPGVFLEDQQVLFSGSGRFFCDAQFPAETVYFGFCIQPMDGAEDSWFRVTDLFTRMGEEGPVQGGWFAGFFPAEEDGETVYQGEFERIYHISPDKKELFDPAPGQFLELHNCTFSIFFGNG